MGTINWEKLLQIEENWVNKYLLDQAIDREFKIVVRGYTVRFSGNLNDIKSFTQGLSEITGKYIHSKYEHDKLGIARALKNSEKIFGAINPQKDGKPGELVLFSLVEGVLRCPMVAHKIPSSFNDQIKGGDGIFIGNYKVSETTFSEAILIGESKIWQDYSAALEDSLLSINRFHDLSTSAQFNSQEFIVAKKGIAQDDEIDSELLFKYLSPDEEEFKKCVRVYPIFIMYEVDGINEIETTAITVDKAEELISNYIKTLHSEHLKTIQQKIEEYDELKKVFLDFFILPVRNVAEFRASLYFEIHGVPYRPKN